jgi:hypothetical protein
MKIFISSLITGFESFREAAKSAIKTLRHEPVMAEDFCAQPNSPQVACLQGLRSSDLVVLILGERYGSAQSSSGISPTHEEYREARGTKPILVFVQEGVKNDDQQSNFLAEVQGWQAGLFRAGFQTASELKDLVTRAIHEYQLANAAGPLDVAALSSLAVKLLPQARNNRSGSPALFMSIVGGPLQRMLRPAELEVPSLANELHQQALFGQQPLFVTTKGVESRIDGDALCLEQPEGARIQLDEQGALFLRLPLVRTQASRNSSMYAMLAIIEEDVVRELESAIAYATWVLERIDPTQRLIHVALAASIEASEHLGWRTQAEQEASPNSGSFRMGGQHNCAVAQVDRPRAALRFEARLLAQDLMVPLRRHWKSS